MKPSLVMLLTLLLLSAFVTVSINAAPENQPLDGSFLKAKINGADWQAEKMLFDKYPSEIVQIWGDKGSTSLRLQLNLPAKGKLEPLIKTDLNSWTDEKFNRYGVESGEIQTTSMDDRWIEGIFHATLKDARSRKQVIITSGAFRIPNPKSFKQ